MTFKNLLFHLFKIRDQYSSNSSNHKYTTCLQKHQKANYQLEKEIVYLITLHHSLIDKMTLNHSISLHLKILLTSQPVPALSYCTIANSFLLLICTQKTLFLSTTHDIKNSFHNRNANKYYLYIYTSIKPLYPFEPLILLKAICCCLYISEFLQAN